VWQASIGMLRSNQARMAGCSRRCSSGYSTVRSGRHGLAGHGLGRKASQCEVRRGRCGILGLRIASSGAASQGWAGTSRFGPLWYFMARHGAAGQVFLGALIKVVTHGLSRYG
jgi:hypothetical protein